jgi:hypothetical protein
MRVLSFFLLTATLLPAQGNNQENAKPPDVTRLIHLRYVPATQILELLRPEGFWVAGQNGLHAIVVQGSADRVAAAEQLIKQLDQPSASETARNQNVEVTVDLIGATIKANGSQSLPAELAGVGRQLHAAFPYADYRLLDITVLRSRAGAAALTEGFMPDFPAAAVLSQKPHYTIGYTISPEVSGQVPPPIKFHDFTFQEIASGQLGAKLQTDFDAQPGQKIVVGKTTVDSDDSAIFLVVTAKELP